VIVLVIVSCNPFLACATADSILWRCWQATLHPSLGHM
jgi:hypothetical protein